MRQDLMTPEELQERYKPKLALELSIEKHKRARLLKNWDTLRPNPDYYFDSGVCALCTKHYRSNGCNDCPLKPEGKTHGCNYDTSSWGNAKDAILERNRKRFMKHSHALIKEMEAKL